MFHERRKKGTREQQQRKEGKSIKAEQTREKKPETAIFTFIRVQTL